MPVDTRAPVQPPAPASVQQLASNRFAPMRADERKRLQQLRDQQHSADQQRRVQRRHAGAIGLGLLILILTGVLMPHETAPPEPVAIPAAAPVRFPPNTQQQLSFLTETVKTTPLPAIDATATAAGTTSPAMAADARPAPAAVLPPAPTVASTPASVTAEPSLPLAAPATPIPVTPMPVTPMPVTTAPLSAPAAALTPPAATADADLIARINAWAGSWAAQDADAYLAFYADDFVPAAGLSRRQWAAQRRQRLRAPAWIAVQVEQFSIAAPGPTRRLVTFRQDYRSPRVKERATKELTLELRDGHWLITRERIVNP